jgi:hypothetical protein
LTHVSAIPDAGKTVKIWPKLMALLPLEGNCQDSIYSLDPR